MKIRFLILFLVIPTLGWSQLGSGGFGNGGTTGIFTTVSTDSALTARNLNFQGNIRVGGFVQIDTILGIQNIIAPVATPSGSYYPILSTDTDVNIIHNTVSQAVDTSSISFRINALQLQFKNQNGSDVAVGISQTSDRLELSGASAGVDLDSGFLRTPNGSASAPAYTNRLSGSDDGIYFGTDTTLIAAKGGRIAGFGDQGVLVGLPTGGYKGAGTINATAVYDDNTLLGPDYVFSEDYPEVSLDKVRWFVKRHKRLPTMPNAKSNQGNGRKSVGQLVMLLWETNEVLYKLIDNQAKELTRLQRKVERLERFGENTRLYK